MKLDVLPSREKAIERASRLFIEKSEAHPNHAVGLATGSTMDGIYRLLNDWGYTPKTMHAFALDNYEGIKPDHKNSYLTELTEKFAEGLGWKGTLHVPGTENYRHASGPEEFELALRTHGPLSVQLLGLGTNGHIAFNEPGSPFDSRTRVVRLAEQTRSDNARFFSKEESVPTHAVTQGLATIRQATSLILIVLGERKKPALLEALETPRPEVPLAALLDHQDITIVTDLQL